MYSTRQLFRIGAVIFLLILVILAIDISRRTTFPGRKARPQADTVRVDSVKIKMDDFMKNR